MLSVNDTVCIMPILSRISLTACRPVTPRFRLPTNAPPIRTQNRTNRLAPVTPSLPRSRAPSQLKRSRHHYSHISYLEMRSINPWSGLWCPRASYFSPCQSRGTLISRNKLMHCATPGPMFIKLFFNEGARINSRPG